MKFNLDYKRFGNRFLPIVTIKVKHKNKSILTEAYLDSGASISAFNAEIAEFLEIDYEKGKIVYPLGTAGHIKAYLTETVIEFNNSDIKCKVLFSKELVNKFNLLGLHGIFDKFKITFDNKNKKIIFEEH